MAGLDIRDLRLNFGAEPVLRDLSLHVREGELLVLLGPSGCGKSSLLQAIAGLVPITAGQIRLAGRDVTKDDPGQRGIGMVFQSYALYPQMTVRGNLSFGLKNAGLPRSRIAQRVADVADMLRIGALMDRKPAALSGGQRQRVAIGRALVRDAGLYLFDEPLSNLDAKLRADLRAEIRHLHRTLGRTMIYVTHDQIEALSLADRIAVMQGGRIVQIATPERLYHHPDTLFVAEFVGSPAINLLPGAMVRGVDGWVFDGPTGRVGLAGYAGDPARADGAVLLGLRPEHFRIVPRMSADAICGQVDRIEPLGPDTYIHVSAADQRIVVRARGQEMPGAGATVFLRPDLTKANLFDTATGRRI